MAMHETQRTETTREGWSPTRWLILASIAIAVIAVVLLVIAYGGGSGGGGGGGY